ncbi:hypothetical protein [Niallia sp. Krafla_26]|uniref:hypothetical protein n=1 Tax=Niallia sp. Krafla_26 TaxID=3064703 RepID=UPI003D1776B0
MEDQRVDQLIAMLQDFKETVDEKVAPKLELDKCNRMIQKLSSFSPHCAVCEQHFLDLEEQIIRLTDRSKQLKKQDYIHHKQIMNYITSHLMKQHKLVTSGYYTSIYMSIGTGLGVAFGQLLFENMALGLSLGIGIGVAIGAGLDGDAKKKGLVL